MFLTVGGRTSCVVPSVQKKTGPVAKDVEEDEVDTDRVENEDHEEGTKKAKAKPKGGKKASQSKKREVDEAAEPAPKAPKGRKRSAKKEEKEPPAEDGDAEDEEEMVEKEDTKSATKKRKSNTKVETTNGADAKPRNQKTPKAKPEVNGIKEKHRNEANSGRRRSTRTSTKE